MYHVQPHAMKLEINNRRKAEKNHKYMESKKHTPKQPMDQRIMKIEIESILRQTTNKNENTTYQNMGSNNSSYKKEFCKNKNTKKKRKTLNKQPDFTYKEPEKEEQTKPKFAEERI